MRLPEGEVDRRRYLVGYKESQDSALYALLAIRRGILSSCDPGCRNVFNRASRAAIADALLRLRQKCFHITTGAR